MLHKWATCKLPLGLLLGLSAGQEEAGHWLIRHFMERMNCLYDRTEADFWNGVAELLDQPLPTSQSTAAARMGALHTILEDALVPFGVADPVMALHCSLGTGAALHNLAMACVGALGNACLHRALRLMHLAKLFMLFNFNDFGAWSSQSRWGTDMTLLASQTKELARLAQSDPGGAAVAVVEPSDFRESSWRIGLVTYCNYNDSVTALTHRSRTNKHAYAERHSYELLHFEKPFVTQAHPWMNKLIAIQENLASFDWLFWVDCDLFFMNPDKTVDALVRSAQQKNSDAALIIAEDGMMINSGAFLLRNSIWGAEFLARTVDLLSAPMPYSFQHMPWHEQAPLMYLALVPWILQGLGDSSFSMREPLSSGYDPHVVLLPQQALNSYPPELVEKTKHAMAHRAYQEGDLVVSFNGCSSVLGGDYCEALHGHYHSLAMARYDHSVQQEPGPA